MSPQPAESRKAFHEFLDLLREVDKGKFGVHRYTPEEWGFTAASLRENLAPYIESFGVALES